jgi:alpha-glucoside transport system permease protein
MKQRISAGTLVLYAVLTLAAALWLFPVLWMYGTSFKPEKEILLSTALIPRPATLVHYVKVLTEASLPRWFFNSVLTSGITTTLVIIVDAMAGYAFARIKFPGRDFLFVAVVGLLVVPLQMTLIPILKIYQGLHLTGTFVGIWLAHTGYGLPFSIYLLRNFFGQLPREMFGGWFGSSITRCMMIWKFIAQLFMQLFGVLPQ